MLNKENIKAIAFDFGGTLDSPFLHWMDIYLQLYTKEMQLPLTKENFWDAYVYAERKMESDQPVLPTHSLLETQLFKATYQFTYLSENNILTISADELSALAARAAKLVTDYSSAYVALAMPTLEKLAKKYTLLLVSNYYGNVAKIVSDMGIASLFASITDSTIEKVRKPDPALWQIAIERQGLQPSEVLIVGDSKKNDILPGMAIGAQVVQGIPAGGEKPTDYTSIESISELDAKLL